MVSDWDDAFAWADADEKWVPVVSEYGTHKRVEILLTVLLGARIPACLKARPWADMQSWHLLWGYEGPIPVLVPESFLEEARAVLAAPYDDDGAFARGAVELDELRQGDSWSARVPVYFSWCVWAYLVLNLILFGL
jgi:hypothetical protein